MALQTEISLSPSRFSAGLDYTGPSQAKTTRSMILFDSFSSPGWADVPGRFVSHGANTPKEAIMENTTLENLAGVVVNDKFNQNAPANFGGVYYYNSGEMLDVMTNGAVVVSVVDGFDPMLDIYVSTDGDLNVSGKLQNSPTNGLLVAGPSYTGAPRIRCITEVKDNLVAVQLNLL